MSPNLDAFEWVTHEGDQRYSLLSDEVVHTVPYIGPRDYSALANNISPAVRILRSKRYSMVVTTGAGIALPFLVVGRLRGLTCHYIESAARAEGPSLTGSTAQHIPGVNLYTQYPAWAHKRWQFRGSLFDGFNGFDAPPPKGINRVVVTLGTMRKFSFRRAVEALLRVLPETVNSDVEILWQTGCTDVSGLGIRTHESIPTRDLHSAIADADLVVAHAGVGSAVTALRAGRRPLLLPRQASYHEHIDNHQDMIAGELARRRLVVTSHPDTLIADHIIEALSGFTSPTNRPPAFKLASA